MFMHFQMQAGVEIQSTEIKIGSATLKEFTKYQSCHALSSGESENYAAVTTTAEALHLQRLLEFLGSAGQAPKETIQQQLALPSSDRGADVSSTLKRVSCAFKRNTRKEG